MKIILFIVFVLMIVGVGMHLIFFREGGEEFEPKVVTFPFSWEEDEDSYLTEITGKNGALRVTVVNITSFGTTLEMDGLGREAEEGYQLYGVYITYENLLHKKWVEGWQIHWAYDFEVKTNRTNLYRGKALYFFRPIELKPEQGDDTWVIFEIRLDEKPVELRYYDFINPGYQSEEDKCVVYIWKIE